MYFGFAYKYTRATYDCFCAPGSHMNIYVSNLQ